MAKLVPLTAAFLSLALLLPASPAAAKEAPAYIALGDSLAFGVGASDPAATGYVALTQDSLARSDRYNHRGLELVNLAVPGATSGDLLLPGGQVDRAVAEIVERLEDDSSADDNVEIITVNVGGNDILSLGTTDSPCLADPLSGDCESIYQDTLGEMGDNLAETLKRLREAAPNADIIVMDLYSPLSGRGGPADIIASFAIEAMNAVTEATVSEAEVGAKMARVYPVFRGHAADLVSEDFVHPNDDGHALMAEVVLAAIEGREPVLPEGYETAQAVEEAVEGPLGQGWLLPLPAEREDDSGTPLLLAIAVPVGVLGIAVIGGVYMASRGSGRAQTGGRPPGRYPR
jgi:acyl-CoA thioesterase-1